MVVQDSEVEVPSLRPLRLHHKPGKWITTGTFSYRDFLRFL